ncbi:hypothetical protein AKJ47_01130 [candidate division MSBL1 archaeon SCGC-AAA261G05]|uniref:Holliday junction resolvase n=2 Tax=candidate division MSBL1 TaxID=215777 RepID=A0A133UYW5_9EURY|nr:hypothetical protein AKJ42_03290 [candidate division MSBL1 archaeon SCGC-AAA261C02]KXB03985.1 hypothetical protein AKJ47_01130 [candidate division MSBL1 archaeon SCGC-AAA261G05]
MGKGTRAERELANLLWNNSFAVMRSPASGSGRKNPQPDLLASDGTRVIGIEVKSTSRDKVYIPEEEVEELEEFCKKFGCEPLFGVRFDRLGWIFPCPEDCERTEKSYKVTRKTKGVNLIEE